MVVVVVVVVLVVVVVAVVAVVWEGVESPCSRPAVLYAAILFRRRRRRCLCRPQSPLPLRRSSCPL